MAARVLYLKAFQKDSGAHPDVEPWRKKGVGFPGSGMLFFPEPFYTCKALFQLSMPTYRAQTYTISTNADNYRHSQAYAQVLNPKTVQFLIKIW